MTTHTGHLFTPSGKWKYDVELDYGLAGLVDDGRGTILDADGGRVEAHDAARLALAASTDAGVSGVTIRELGNYWTLVVPKPPNGCPILVHPPERVVPGDRVRLDTRSHRTWNLPEGSLGTVMYVDDDDVFVAWDGRGRTAMRRGEDGWTVLR